MEERFYFEPGFSLHSLCAAESARLLKCFAEEFGAIPVARDNWIELSGPEPAIRRTIGFLSALQQLFLLRKKELERGDVELLLRRFAASEVPDVEALWRGRVTLSTRKHDLLPRSRRQLEYLNAMRSHEVVFGIGPAGTGKTYLAMAMAVSFFLKGEVSRIILTRPARESGERLGFLPGTLEEKVSPYLRPLYDALYEMLSVEEAQELIARGVIEVAPLAFMRGRSLNNAFIILDEAQNTTSEQMLMFLTRMGFGSRCVITGDPSQSDLAAGEESGLRKAIDRLRQIPELAFVFFGTGDVVRHALLEKIILAYHAVPENSGKEGEKK